MPASIPTSTYRLQFHHDFNFRQATAILDYLSDLGISHVYSSPFFQASEGSTHGYDVADHNQLNPALGSARDFQDFIAGLLERGLGHLLDFVPNHMGISEPVNRWWMDVLENGRNSLFAHYFDIEWHPIKEELENKVLLPILGDRYGNVLERGDFHLDCRQGAFFLNYADAKVPLNPVSYPFILERVASQTEGQIPAEWQDELWSISRAFGQLTPRSQAEPEAIRLRAREKEVGKRRLADLLTKSEAVAKALDATLRHLEGSPGDGASFDDLHELLCAQTYRLAFWRVAAEEINYRRFFDITSLAGIRVEVPEVFDATHQLVLQMIARGEVTGLRIDHIDGLWSPCAYLAQLQKAVDPAEEKPLYLLVEKILGPGEQIPADWPVHGTTGYEFAADLVRLLVDEKNETDFSRIYAAFGGTQNFDDLVYDKKILVTRMALASEIAELGHLLDLLSEKNRLYRDFTLHQLTSAVRETIACFNVYRTYVAPDRPVREEDRLVIRRAIRRARRKNPTIDRHIFGFLEKILTLDLSDPHDTARREEHVRFVMKFQQISGPIMAKGLEDTAFYIYNRLVALNDVGGDPARFGWSTADFHAACLERLACTPHTLLATSTHDTKRSEDVRARLAALSEMPDDWQRHLQLWQDRNTLWKTDLDGRPSPSLNEEYLFYQTLVGAWPLDGLLGLDEHTRPDLIRRIQDYMVKALKEAKINSSWIEPDEEWENATLAFVAGVLEPVQNAVFLENFDRFTRRVAALGAINSLTQTVLKCTTPGVPDFYQGCEIWDFSLVDPDNRRPVDYAHRQRLLASLPAASPASASALLADWPSEQIKLFLTQKLLHLRRSHPALFQSGSYRPLEIDGSFAHKIVGFLRDDGRQKVAVLVPRLTAPLAFPPIGSVWEETTCLLPVGIWQDIFSGVSHNLAGPAKLAEVLAHLPWSCLVQVNQVTSK